MDHPQENLKIEKLTLGNLEEFLPVFKEVLKTGFPEYSSELVRFFVKKDFSKKVFLVKIKKNQWWGLLARVDGEIGGFLIADPPYGGVSYCPWLGTVQNLRKKGIGSRLLSEWEKRVREEGGHKLILLTQSEKNRKFYLKNGFRNEGFEEKSWFGLDCWRFGKVIGKPKPKIFLKLE
jgi:ribosomal protein S18 acetylase RimI-like enzyme